MRRAAIAFALTLPGIAAGQATLFGSRGTLLVEDADTVPAQSYSLSLAADVGAVPGDRYHAAPFGLAVGVTHRLELGAALLARSAQDPSARGAPVDVRLFAKHRLLVEGLRRPGLAVVVAADHPLQHWDFSPALVAHKNVGPLLLTGEAGWRFVRRRSAADPAGAFYGVGASWTFTSRLTGFLQLTGESGPGFANLSVAPGFAWALLGPDPWAKLRELVRQKAREARAAAERSEPSLADAPAARAVPEGGGDGAPGRAMGLAPGAPFARNAVLRNPGRISFFVTGGPAFGRRGAWAAFAGVQISSFDELLQDSDGDTIPDRLDKCPFEPEDWDGFEDDDGCPDDGANVLRRRAEERAKALAAKGPRFTSDFPRFPMIIPERPVPSFIMAPGFTKGDAPLYVPIEPPAPAPAPPPQPEPQRVIVIEKIPEAKAPPKPPAPKPAPAPPRPPPGPAVAMRLDAFPPQVDVRPAAPSPAPADTLALEFPRRSSVVTAPERVRVQALAAKAKAEGRPLVVWATVPAGSDLLPEAAWRLGDVAALARRLGSLGKKDVSLLMSERQGSEKAGVVVVLTIAPKGGATEPKAGGTEPKGGATEPKGGGTEPKGEGTAPKGEATAPKAEATEPKAEATAPKGETPAAKGEAPAAKAEVTAPKGEVPAPKVAMVPPKPAEPPPPRRDPKLDALIASLGPREEAVRAQAGELASKEEALAAREKAGAAKRDGLAAREKKLAEEEAKLAAGEARLRLATGERESAQHPNDGKRRATKLAAVGPQERALADEERKEQALERKLAAQAAGLGAKEAKEQRAQGALRAQVEKLRAREEKLADPKARAEAKAERLAAEEALARAGGAHAADEEARLGLVDGELAAREARLAAWEKRLAAVGSETEELRPGPAGQRQLAEAVRRYTADVRECVDNELKRTQMKKGDGVFALTIDARGRVARAAMKEERDGAEHATQGSLKGTYLEGCLVHVSGRWRFPRGDGEYDLEIPIHVTGSEETR